MAGAASRENGKKGGRPRKHPLVTPEVLPIAGSSPVIGRPFRPGQSGNPSGRPAGERKYLVEKYGDDAHVLHEQMDVVLADHKTPASAKVDILKFKIERMGGKAPLTMIIDAPVMPAAIVFLVQLQPGAENRT